MKLKDVEPIICELQNEEQYGADYYYPIELLKNAPTIEAKPVVHAHWEGSRCSNCKRNLFELFDAGSHLIESFKEEVVCCPYCGVQMDEVVVEENATTTNNTQKMSVDKTIS